MDGRIGFWAMSLGGIVVAGAASALDASPPEGLTRPEGLWRLLSYEVEVRATGAKEPVMGARPTGYAYFTPEGRVFFLLTGEGRKPAKDAAGKAALLDTMVSYTGKVTLEGDRWTAKLDTAWNPEWVGTEQARTFRIEGDKLSVLTPWRVMPNWAQHGETRSIVTFERASDR